MPTFRTVPIFEHELTMARQAWGDGLVSISHAFEAAGIAGARAVAGRMLDSLYAYNVAPVLFKPTLAGGAQTFRTSKRGALSYYVGHDPEYPQDAGFGIRGWRDVRSETAARFTDGDVALWMGWVHLTDRDGQVTTVDKSWGYKLGADGVLRIVLHHSSLPYQP